MPLFSPTFSVHLPVTYACLYFHPPFLCIYLLHMHAFIFTHLFCAFIKEGETVIFIRHKWSFLYKPVEELCTYQSLEKLVVGLLSTLQETFNVQVSLLTTAYQGNKATKENKSGFVDKVVLLADWTGSQKCKMTPHPALLIISLGIFQTRIILLHTLSQVIYCTV